MSNTNTTNGQNGGQTNTGETQEEQKQQQRPPVIDTFEEDWYRINAEFDNLKNVPDNEKEAKKAQIATSLYNAIVAKAKCLNITNNEGAVDIGRLFNANDVAFQGMSAQLAKQNVKLVRNNDNSITMKIGNGIEGTFTMKLENNGINYSLVSDEPEEKKKKDDTKKKETNWLPIILILVAVTLIGLITLFLILKNKKDKEEKEKQEQQQNDAKDTLDKGVVVDDGKPKDNGEYKPNEQDNFIDADGKVIKLSEEITYKDGDLSDKAQMAVDIENNPNYSYTINGRRVINPQASYVDGNQTMTFYDISSKSEVTLDVSKIKSFTCNGTDVDKQTIDLMCSYTRNPSGKVSFDGMSSLVQINKDSGALNVEFYTKDGNLISTYSKDNITKNGENYGYKEGDVFYEFPANIQDSIVNALDNIKSNYPDISLNSLIKGCEIS